MIPLPHPRLLRAPLLLGLALVSGFGVQEALDSITAEEIRSHLLLLSSDQLEGRAPGSRGADIAAQYIAARFVATGLQAPGGSHFQEVPLTGITPDPTSLSLAFEGDGIRTPAEYPADAVLWPGSPLPSIQVSGELVFVGYGIDAGDWSWDDFKGRDLNGKILLFLVGDPPAPPDEPGLFEGRALTYYGRWSYKIEEARRRGATGALLVHRSDVAGYDWDVVASSWSGERLVLADDGAGPAAVYLQGWLTNGFARQVLATAGLDLDELMVRAARRDFRPVATGLTVRSRLNSRIRSVGSRNVVGLLPGRTDEVVVYTAHYDHLGTGLPVDGDSVYNGAYDNASGVSVLLEVADAFTRLDEPTERGILFLATTGEEAGLLGARHYVDQPLVPLDRTVAVLNIDGASLWGETDDVIALGAARSTLGASLAPRASELGLQLRGDPAPERGAFFRSDHFPFTQAGIPALMIQHGLDFRHRPAGWGDSLMTAWQSRHYHQPSDEIPADVDLSGAVQQARLLFTLGYDLASDPRRPEWILPLPTLTRADSARAF